MRGFPALRGVALGNAHQNPDVVGIAHPTLKIKVYGNFSIIKPDSYILSSRHELRIPEQKKLSLLLLRLDIQLIKCTLIYPRIHTGCGNAIASTE
ncbi:hypothetical protein Cal7507_2307 [Calothrix sp. PCC 7507]|nr:hypothetical protein Cal7507_2307 [Calothrix sp. PCC 7507]